MEANRWNHDMDDNRVAELARLAVKQDLQKKQALGQPIARYDPLTKEVYLEKSDGTREIVGSRLRRGRFSERKKET